MGYDLLENSDLAALAEPRVGDGFANEINVVTKKKYASRSSMRGDSYVNATGSTVTNEEKIIRAKYGALVGTCQQGNTLLQQVENELNRYKSLLTNAKKNSEKKSLRSYVSALEGQKARISNALTNLKCTEQKEAQEAEIFKSQLQEATSAQQDDSKSKQGKIMTYVAFGAIAVLMGTILYAIAKVK